MGLDSEGKERWVAGLEKNFRPVHSTTALDNLFRDRYRVLDLRNHREPSEYILNIISHARDTEFDDSFNQFAWVYKQMGAALSIVLIYLF